MLALLRAGSGEMEVQRFARRADGHPRGNRDQFRAAQEIQDGGARGLGRFDLLKFEFFRPGDNGTPNQLVDQHNDRHHHSQAPDDGARIARVGRGLKVRAQPGKPQVAIPQHEHLARHQEKPGARHRHNGIPNQSDGRVGKFHLPQPLPPAQAVNLRGFVHLAGNALQGRVETEGHVPDLPRHDQHDGPHLRSQLAVRKQSDHGQHDGGKKAEDGNGLQDIQQRNHESFRFGVVRGHIAVHQGETQAEKIRDGNSRHREEGILGQGAGGKLNDCLGIDGTGSVTRKGEQAVEERQPREQDGQVSQ